MCAGWRRSCGNDGPFRTLADRRHRSCRAGPDGPRRFRHRPGRAGPVLAGVRRPGRGRGRCTARGAGPEHAVVCRRAGRQYPARGHRHRGGAHGRGAGLPAEPGHPADRAGRPAAPAGPAVRARLPDGRPAPAATDRLARRTRAAGRRQRRGIPAGNRREHGHSEDLRPTGTTALRPGLDAVPGDPADRLAHRAAAAHRRAAVPCRTVHRVPRRPAGQQHRRLAAIVRTPVDGRASAPIRHRVAAADSDAYA